MKDAKKFEQYTSKQDGINLVLDKALRSYERLPMLQIILEKATRAFTISIRNYLSENINTEITKLSSTRFKNFTSSLSYPSCNIIYKCLDTDTFGVMNFGNDLIFILIDVLLGGKKNENTNYSGDKYLSFIEQEIITQFSQMILNDLGIAFEQVSHYKFDFEKIENNPNFINVCRPGDVIVLLSINVEINGKRGSMDIVLPYHILDPIKGKLQQVFLQDRALDASWNKLLFSSVKEVEFELKAVIKNPREKKMSDITRLKVGEVLLFDAENDPDVSIFCENVEIMKGKIGKVKNNKAIVVTDFEI